MNSQPPQIRPATLSARPRHRARCAAVAFSATPCLSINDDRESVDLRGQRRPRRPGSHRGHQLRPHGQERPGEAQLGSAMLSVLRRPMTRKGSSLNEPGRKLSRRKRLVHVLEFSAPERCRASGFVSRFRPAAVPAREFLEENPRAIPKIAECGEAKDHRRTSLGGGASRR